MIAGPIVRYAHIRDELHADRRQTELALVYLHGFSASRQETAPLSEDLARQLGANLFVTRLSGHGRSPQAMGEPSVRDWLQAP